MNKRNFFKGLAILLAWPANLFARLASWKGTANGTVECRCIRTLTLLEITNFSQLKAGMMFTVPDAKDPIVPNGQIWTITEIPKTIEQGGHIYPAYRKLYATGNMSSGSQIFCLSGPSWDQAMEYWKFYV